MKYRVHIYAVVRVPVEVEAKSQQGAIQKAVRYTDLEYDFKQGEYADDIESFVVDEIGDKDYLNTKSYDKHHQIIP
jgi:hypothetical protein